MTVTQHGVFVDTTFERLADDSVLAGLFATSVPDMYWPPANVAKARTGAMVALLTGDDLEEIQAIVEDTVHELTHAVHGFEVPEQHAPWQPHITLVYNGDAERLAELTDRTGPITFDRIRVAFAGRDCDIPLRPAAPMTIDDGHTSPVGPSAQVTRSVFNDFDEGKVKRDRKGRFAEKVSPAAVLSELDDLMAKLSGLSKHMSEDEKSDLTDALGYLKDVRKSHQMRADDEDDSVGDDFLEVESSNVGTLQMNAYTDGDVTVDWDDGSGLVMPAATAEELAGLLDELVDVDLAPKADVLAPNVAVAERTTSDGSVKAVLWDGGVIEISDDPDSITADNNSNLLLEPSEVDAFAGALEELAETAQKLRKIWKAPGPKASLLGRVLASRARLAWAESGCRPLRAKYDPTQKRDNDGQWTDGVPGSANLNDKLKLGKRAPAGYLVRSSKKLKTDYADVGIAEVDGPDGPHVRVGIIGGERGKWDAGFTGESRKAQLRQQIAEKRAVFDSDDNAPDDIEDQIEALESELEDLDGARTAILSPQAMVDFRRQLGDGLEAAIANKAQVDADAKAQDAIDEKRNAIIAEHSDAALERKISKAAHELRSARKTVKRLENELEDGSLDDRDREYTAGLLARWKADVAEHDAELAPLLARRAQLVPPDALARLEDLDRQYHAIFDTDITDMITSAEVSTPGGSRVRAEIWGSDDVDEQFVNTRLLVLTPGETTADVTDLSDDYGYFSGLKGLSKLITGLDVSSSGGVQNRLRAKYDPSQPRDPGGENGGQWTDGPGIDLPEGALKGISILDQAEYAEMYGTFADEEHVRIYADGTALTARSFENGDLHVVLDLPGGGSQVLEDMDSDAMRQLADDLQGVLDTDFDPDGDYLEDIVADADSHDHNFYIARYSTGDVRIQPTNDDGEMGDYLDLSEEDAQAFAYALNDAASGYDDDEFGDEAEVEHLTPGGGSHE